MKSALDYCEREIENKKLRTKSVRGSQHLYILGLTRHDNMKNALKSRHSDLITALRNDMIQRSFELCILTNTIKSCTGHDPPAEKRVL